MRFGRTSRYLVTLAIILGIIHAVYPRRPYLKKSTLRKRLLQQPTYLRPKRQLFREDIPHHRPLSGNTYYLHAGFPHPSRWHEGPQIIPPNPEPITHHHFQEHHGALNDEDHGHPHHDEHHGFHGGPMEHLIHKEPHPHPHPHPHSHPHPEGPGPGDFGPGPGELGPEGPGQLGPAGPSELGQAGPVTVIKHKDVHSVNIHNTIVHPSAFGGNHGLIDNTLGNPPPPQPPLDQANFDPIIPHRPPDPGIDHFTPSHGPRKKKPKQPHSEPELFGEDNGEFGDYGPPAENHIEQLPPPHAPPPPPPPPPPPHHHPHPHNVPERKPKTIIHYHPITVGNIINFNDENKPHGGYGPPDHIPGHPLSHKEVLHAISQPFIKTPFKTVNGPPEFLDTASKGVQYGPPDHTPGPPLGHLDLSPPSSSLLPSYGPPVKGEPLPHYGPALPVLAHLHHHHPPPPPPPPPPHMLHHPLPHPPPPRRFRGGRGRHRHHHIHHYHHSASHLPGIGPEHHGPPMEHHPPPHHPHHHPHHHPLHLLHGPHPGKPPTHFFSHRQNYRSHGFRHHHKSFWKL